MSKKVAAVGTRENCAGCGRTVWFRKAGTMGYSGSHPGETVFQWAARKGTKPRPLECPAYGYHHVKGFASQSFAKTE